MGIKAKFAVSTVARDASGNETLSAIAVYGSDGSENATWSKYTPAGSLSMTISNPAAQGAFQPGEEIYLDIYSAAKKEAK